MVVPRSLARPAGCGAGRPGFRDGAEVGSAPVTGGRAGNGRDDV